MMQIEGRSFTTSGATLFAFFFDEDHAKNAVLCGPQFASKIITAIERMVPIPTTRLLTGGLLHNSLVYDVESITLGRKADKTKSRLSTQERAQHSVPNYDRRLSIICDLAETLSGDQSSFAEEKILNHLACKNIWVIVTPNLSEAQASAVHESISSFGPYLGYAAIDPGNPLHRRLFLQSLFNDKAIGSQGLAFRRDFFDEDDDHAGFAPEYGSRKDPVSYDAEDFDARFPQVAIPTVNSRRGDLTAMRLSGHDPGHRAKVARELINIESKKIKSPISFSARKPEEGAEFFLPPAKFSEYLLNHDHADGGPKAKFFIESLDIQPADWRYLADQILQGVKSAELYRLKLSPYGASHGALILVTGRNGRNAVIETGWRVPEEGPALFVTAYPAEEKLSKGLSPNIGRVPPQDVVGEHRWDAIHEFAHRAGMSAAEDAIPTPMVLEKFGTVWEGECGFGWVQLSDGRASFARWIVAQKHGYASYPGVGIYSKAMTQSVVKNRAYAEAYAEVLRSNGIDCKVRSRLD